MIASNERSPPVLTIFAALFAWRSATDGFDE
jgi:hypothetical protein